MKDPRFFEQEYNAIMAMAERGEITSSEATFRLMNLSGGSKPIPTPPQASLSERLGGYWNAVGWAIILTAAAYFIWPNSLVMLMTPIKIISQGF
jgi:hypothetical protein